MLQVIVNVFAFGIIGGILGSIGCHYNTWQFWGIMVSCVVIQINSSIY
jgi:hypothetical protein